MAEKKDKTKILVFLSIFLLGTALLIYLTFSLDMSNDNLLFMGVFTVIAFILMFRPVAIDTAFEYTPEDVAAYAAIFLKGPASAAWISFISSFFFEIWRLIRALRKKKGKIRPLALLINFANPFLRILIVGPAGLVFERIRSITPGVLPGTVSSFYLLPAFLACVAVFYVTSTLLGTFLTSLKGGISFKNFLESWRDDWKLIAPHLFMLAPLGILLAVLYKKIPYASVLLVVPVYILHTAIESIRHILREALNTIEFMAITLDQRDSYTYGHSERVSRYAAAIARRMGLSHEKIEDIKNAGLIHDLGKIAIPDRVLRKPAKLDDNEFSVMKTHTHTTTVLYRSFGILSNEIPLKTAMYHHERFDGSGYLYGLKGKEIPLGSRILAVADTYDAMTSDRPYRKGLPEEEARQRIIDASGTQLDPEVVEIFLQLHSEGELQKIRREYMKERVNRKQIPKKLSPELEAS